MPSAQFMPFTTNEIMRLSVNDVVEAVRARLSAVVTTQRAIGLAKGLKNKATHKFYGLTACTENTSKKLAQ